MKDPVVGVVHTAFGAEREVTLESGRKFVVPRWSVRKALALGATVSNVLSSFFEVLQSRGLDQENTEVDTAQFIQLLPAVMEKSADDLAVIIESSLTMKAGVKQITKSQIMGDEEDDENLDFEDFPELLEAIIRLNMTEKVVGKWKSLFQSGMGLIPGMTENSPT